MASASTEKSIHEEPYMELLREVYDKTGRDEQNMKLITYIGGLQDKKAAGSEMDDFDTKLLAFYESEWDHAYLVCTALRRIRNKRRHDWTKDYVYVYALAGKFCFSVTHEDFGSKWLEEVNRHYKLEPHHPQHTKTGGVITRLDVEETALDQLAREIYRNKGGINQESMTRYLPVFEGEDGEQKLQWFQQDIVKHAQMMKDVYEEWVRDEAGEPRDESSYTKISCTIL